MPAPEPLTRLWRFFAAGLPRTICTWRVSVAPATPEGERLVNDSTWFALVVRSAETSDAGSTQRTSLFPARSDAAPRLTAPSVARSLPLPLEYTMNRRTRVLAFTRSSSGAYIGKSLISRPVKIAVVAPAFSHMDSAYRSAFSVEEPSRVVPPIPTMCGRTAGTSASECRASTTRWSSGIG